MKTREDSMIINSLVRQALTSAQEVMGDNGLNAVLRTSGQLHLHRTAAGPWHFDLRP